MNSMQVSIYIFHYSIVNNVYFMGGAVGIKSMEKLKNSLTVVRGKIVNGYSKSDYILHLFRACMGKIPIGRIPLFEVENPENMTNSKRKKKHRLEMYKQGLRVYNYDLTKVAGGHLTYRENTKEILKMMNYIG